MTLVVQVNGKVRDRLEMPAGTNKEETERLALAAPKVQDHLEGKQIVKVIVVPEAPGQYCLQLIEQIFYIYNCRYVFFFKLEAKSKSKY